MISQNCPKCGSDRIRRGYRPTPLWSKIIFRYNLLCDNCNWEFSGFAVPGTVSVKPTRKNKKQTLPAEPVEEASHEEINFSAEPLKAKAAAAAELNNAAPISGADAAPPVIEKAEETFGESEPLFGEAASGASAGETESKQEKAAGAEKITKTDETSKKLKKQKVKKRIKLNL